MATLSAIAQAGLIFSDIRPRSYKIDRTLDIMVGNLYSSRSIVTHDLYWLNYCSSSKEKHSYTDEKALEDDTPDITAGTTMWDNDLHESFFSVSDSSQS